MTLSRREAVRGGALLAAGLAGVSMLGGCRGVVRGDLAAPEADDATAVPDPMWRDILRTASLSPSGHNTQPWTVTMEDGGSLLIGSAPERFLPAVDPDGREMFLSIGAFIECLLMAAAARALVGTPEVLARSQADRDVVRVHFERGTAGPAALERLRLRRTVRNEHLTRPLATADVAALTASGRDMLVLPRGGAMARAIEEATLEANRQQAARDDAQAELAHWIRFRDADARRERNGLTPESMEIHGAKGLYVRMMMDSSDVISPSFRASGIDAVRAQLASYGSWMVLTSPDSSVPTLIDVGRRWLRMLLETRPRMIAVHPMTQALEEAPVRAQLVPTLGVSGAVQFIMRVSYLASYPEPVSLRMPLRRFVRSAGPTRG